MSETDRVSGMEGDRVSGMEGTVAMVQTRLTDAWLVLQLYTVVFCNLLELMHPHLMCMTG